MATERRSSITVTRSTHFRAIQPLVRPMVRESSESGSLLLLHFRPRVRSKQHQQHLPPPLDRDIRTRVKDKHWIRSAALPTLVLAVSPATRKHTTNYDLVISKAWFKWNGLDSFLCNPHLELSSPFHLNH